MTSVPAILTIAQLDPFPTRPNKTLELVEGNTVAIACDPPYSNPLPIVQFYKDGITLDSETGM